MEKREFSSNLGYVFEGAFKVGLLEVVKPERAKDFEKAFKESILEIFKPEEYYREILERDWERIGTYIDDQNKYEKYLKTIYLLGYNAGKFYGETYKDMKLIKYNLGDESWTAGTWKNADLIFIHDQTLYVVDFKLSNAEFWITQYFSKATRTEKKDLPYMPAVNFGVPVNISVGELSFVNFLERYIRVQKALENLQEVLVELKGFTQVISYAVDYLCEKGDKGLREVCLELIYPLPESYRARFYINEGDSQLFLKYREKVVDIYKSVRDKEGKMSDLIGVHDSQVRIKRLKQEFKSEIEKLEMELNGLEGKPVKLTVQDISVARDDVEKALQEFNINNEPARCLILLHSAGSGKTTKARQKILEQEGKHIVIYMASRLILLDREKEALEGLRRPDVRVIYPRDRRVNNREVIHTGRAFAQRRERVSKIWQAVESIKESVEENKYKWIWALITTQSVLESEYNETSDYLKELITYRILKEYTLHIIVDEFLGYRNGLYTIVKLLEFAKQVKEQGGRIFIYLFDANGYSPDLMKKLLQEYREYGVIPDSLVLCDYVEEVNFNYDGIPIKARAKHGYPSKELMLYKKFLKVEKEEELSRTIKEYVLSTFKDRDKSTAFLYIQDKDLIVELSRSFEEEGLSTIIVTASSRKSQEEINQGSSHIILGTSSVSRGIDFSRPNKPVDYIYIFVFDWGIEQNLVEVIQAISRARGDAKTESRPKHLHLVFPLMPLQEHVLENIKTLSEIDDIGLIESFYKLETLRQKKLLSEVTQKIIESFLISPSDFKKVLVPIPAQHKTVYKSNRIVQLESIITFLDDIYLMELRRNKDKALRIKKIQEMLYESIILNARSKERENIFYYHPYVLIRDGELYLSFDNEKRHEITKLLEDLWSLLKSHNEERSEDLKRFLTETASIEIHRISYLIPVYSIVFTDNVLKQNEFMRFRLRKRVGRGGANVLGGGLEFLTRCFVPEGGSPKEYAIVPLGEDYPYVEVLSGRFAKFPIEFIIKLLEEVNEQSVA